MNYDDDDITLADCDDFDADDYHGKDCTCNECDTTDTGFARWE